MTMLRFISLLLIVATVDAMTDCDVYQRSWNIVAHFNKADLSVKEAEIYFPTTDPPLFSENLVINMGSMTATIGQYLEAYNDVTIKGMQANPTWVECSPWEWCHMHLMTTYYGKEGGSISLRQFWTFVFNTDCRVTKFHILMEARDNDILTTAFGNTRATEL
jgi:hypothetical protein